MTKRKEGGIRLLKDGRIAQWGYGTAGTLVAFYKPILQGQKWKRGRSWRDGRFVDQAQITITMLNGDDALYQPVTDGVIVFGDGEPFKWRVVAPPNLSADEPLTAQSKLFHANFEPAPSMFNPHPVRASDYAHPPAS